MLLIKEEKERLQNYLTSLKGFVFENDLPEDKISALKQEINRVESALLDVKIEPLYEIVTRDGEFIQRVANAFNLEQITWKNLPIKDDCATIRIVARPIRNICRKNDNAWKST